MSLTDISITRTERDFNRLSLGLVTRSSFYCSFQRKTISNTATSLEGPSRLQIAQQEVFAFPELLSEVVTFLAAEDLLTTIDPWIGHMFPRSRHWREPIRRRCCPSKSIVSQRWIRRKLLWLTIMDLYLAESPYQGHSFPLCYISIITATRCPLRT